MTDNTLAPCPFCRRPPKVEHVVQGAEQVHYWRVVCDVPPSSAYRDPTLCRGVSGPRKLTEAEAIAAWNTRSDTALAKAVREIISAYRQHDAAGVDVMYQIAADALAKLDAKP